MPTLAPILSAPVTDRPPLVREGQRLTPEQLQAEARKLIERKGLTQVQVADLIGAHQSHVGAAMGSDPGSRASVLARIVDALSPTFTAEREVVYRVARKA